jgi:hypothetical protein
MSQAAFCAVNIRDLQIEQNNVVWVCNFAVETKFWLVSVLV